MMTEERKVEYASLYSERLDDKTPVWLLGWAEVAKKGGNELMAEVGRLQQENAKLWALIEDVEEMAERDSRVAIAIKALREEEE